jgi:hypothetical protein
VQVREPTIDVPHTAMEHIEFLNRRVLALLERLKFRRNPAVATGC